MPSSLELLAAVLNAYQKPLSETKKQNQSFFTHPANPIPRHYISNDHDIGVLLEGLQKRPSLKNPQILNLALCAGEAHFLSCLPEFQRHVDAIILVDIQEDILLHNQFILNVFKDSNSPEEFIKKVTNANKNPILLKYSSNQQNYNVTINSDSLLQMIEADKINTGSKHFLSSSVRFHECKQALANVAVFTMSFDLLLPVQAKQFKSDLSAIGHQFTIINVTNIPDYDTDGSPLRDVGMFLETKSVKEQIAFQERENTAKVMQILTGNGQCLLWYSHLTFDRAILKLNWSESVSAYQKKRQDYLSQFAAHFYPSSFVLNPKPQIVPIQSGELWCEPEITYIAKNVRFCWDNKNTKSLFSSLQLIKCNDGEQIIAVTIRSSKTFSRLSLFSYSSVDNNLKRLQSLLFNQQIPLYFLSQINESCFQFTSAPATKEFGRTFIELLGSIQELPKGFLELYDDSISVSSEPKHKTLGDL